MFYENLPVMRDSAKNDPGVGGFGPQASSGSATEYVLTDVRSGTNARVHEMATIPKGTNSEPGVRPQVAAAVLVVDDCTLYRENLALALSANDGLMTYSAWDMDSMLGALEANGPDVVLLSMSTKDSPALLHAMTTARPDIKVIVLGVWEGDESTIVATAEAGVKGYHLRDESFTDLLTLIREVVLGESVCSPKVAAVLLRRLSELASARKPDMGALILTAREMEILGLLEAGLSNREIADQLCIALHTVKNHVHSVLAKLGVSTRAQAVAAARAMRKDEMGLMA